MKWFEGSINEAVATSKLRKTIFVVFIEGKDDTSVQVAQAIDTPEVSSRLEQDEFVAIRLESGSETYRFFAQIYQLVPVPSIFFIGENGSPLEIVAGETTASELASKIDAVLVKAKKNVKHASDGLIEAEKTAATSDNNARKVDNNVSVDKASDSNANTGEDAAVTSNSKESVSKSVDEAAIKNNITTDNVNPEPSTSVENTEKSTPSEITEENPTKQLTTEEKIERARQLIDMQRRQKVDEEDKKELDREVERRKVSRDMQKLWQKQQDVQMKHAHEEIIKEKAANAAAREKIREQIAQDKIERKQKKIALQEQAQERSEPPKSRVPLSADSTITRIQFRLPSGNPHMGQFQSSSTLRSLRSYVVENIELPFRQFTMSTSFPRRELGNEDDDKTLLELELVPTAVILILPLKNSNITTMVTAAKDDGFVSRFMWYFFSPLLRAYNYIVSYFSGGNRGGPRNQHDDSNGIPDVSNSDGTVPTNVQNVPQFPGWFRRYLNSNQGGTTIRVQGNIHRLHSGGDDNDENNTWNGNSTQQM